MASMDDFKKTLDEGLTIARNGVTYLAERAEDASRVAGLRVRIFLAPPPHRRDLRGIGRSGLRQGPRQRRRMGGRGGQEGR